MLRTFTIATTAANDDMAPLHDRMAVILEPNDWPVWLGEGAGERAELLRPNSPGTVRLWPVSRAVNSVRNNGPEVLHIMTDVAPLTPAEALVGINAAVSDAAFYKQPLSWFLEIKNSSSLSAWPRQTARCLMAEDRHLTVQIGYCSAWLIFLTL